MDKIMSARVNEAVIRRIGMLAKRLNISRKAVIERAIDNYTQQIDSEEDVDILTVTCGTWKRDEDPDEIVQKIKETMRHSQERYKR
ncbi:MAG: hypothetical protein JXL81_00975 [Deltaproteobacteria bacterium]|nr:hypothetical protein [Deltaproteobacteria bacterium]